MRDVRDKRREQLEALKKVVRFNRLCELKVIEQGFNVARTSIVMDAWSRQQRISVHAADVLKAELPRNHPVWLAERASSDR